MTFVGILVLVSTIINSSSNMSVNAQQQSPKTEAPEKVLSLFSMKRVDQQTSQKNVLPWPV